MNKQLQYIYYVVWDEITYLFQNFNTIEVWEMMNNFRHTLLGMWLLIHAVIEVNHVNKRGPREQTSVKFEWK